MEKFVVIGGEDTKIKGIFFRSPIQSVDYDWYGDFSSPMYPQGINKILNLFRIKRAKKHAESDNAAGFRFLEFCCPIYFKRTIREMITIPASAILKIHSKGYEPYKNNCSGACVEEVTTITYMVGKRVEKITIVSPERYNFAYRHVIAKMVPLVELK